MKIWKIPVFYEMKGSVEVEADTLEDAIDIVKNGDKEVLNPKNGYYLNGSLTVIDYDLNYIREYYNSKQEDKKIKFKNLNSCGLEDGFEERSSMHYNPESIDDIISQLTCGIQYSKDDLNLIKKWLLEFKYANQMSLVELNDFCWEDSEWVFNQIF